MENLTAETEAYAKRWGMWQNGSRILVACSGGPDSMALLSVLLEIAERIDIFVAAAHFHHGIRGNDADADAEYVRRFCEQRNIPCRIGKGDVPSYAAQHKCSLEAAARKLRYRFLFREARRMDVSVIALAHQADDQAETVLMRILRGTGIDGLGAIRPKVGRLIRPLLFAPRSAIEAYCAAHDIEPRHDATNDVLDGTRNRLRLSLFPLLRRDYNPSIRESLCRLASIASDHAAFLDEMVQKAWHDVVLAESMARICFSKSALRGLPRMLRMEILRAAAEKLGGRMSFSFVHYDGLAELVAAGTTGKMLDLPSDVHAYAHAKEVLLIKGAKPSVLWEPRRLKLFGKTRIDEAGITLNAREAEPGETVQGPHEVLIDAAYLQDAVVRRRINGDRFVMGSGSQSVKKLLIDRKVPREKRDEIPIVVSREHILWIVGIRQADIGRAQKGRKAVYLRIQYDKAPEY